MAKIQETFDLSKKFESVTVIWSGNGYHLNIPAESHNTILEDISEFKNYDEPSKLFLRFAEWYLSNHKADLEHYSTVSFKNCLLRIPGSFNSKNMSQVRILQRWNGNSKVHSYLLYSKFLAYLVDQGTKMLRRPNSIHTILSQTVRSGYFTRPSRKDSINWIEQLLQIPLYEHRKYCVWRILAPYFINVKHLSFNNSYDKIYQWLDMCSQFKALNFDPETRINDCLNRAPNTGYLPISFDNQLKEPRTLKIDNRELSNIVKSNVCFQTNNEV